MKDIESYEVNFVEHQEVSTNATFQSDDASILRSEPIAIIGMGMRLPGNVNNAEDLWNLLINKKDAISDYPISRNGDIDAIVDKNKGKNKIITKRGGFIEGVEYFDAGFFNISPLEAEKMDPAQRLLLEVAQEAIENSGLKDTDLNGTQTGVFIGNWTSDYEHRLEQANEDIDVYATTGSGRYALSGRLSFFYNLQGPSLTLDTACSSSIVALNIASQSLNSGECNMALVGASNTITDFFVSKGYSRSGLLSEYGECRFGDIKSTGYVRSEGAGMVVLKRLSDAVKDGNHIHAVILSTVTNSDGRANKNLFAPSAITQEIMIAQAIKKAGINPADLVYVEAHGTGTKAGDPTEITSIWNAVSEKRSVKDKIFAGSIKTNIGHTEAVAGLAGLFKVILSLKHKTILPSLHFDTPNPKIAWENIGLTIPRDSISWPADKPLIAGVNSFGITGSNAHAIISLVPEGTPPTNKFLSVRNDIFILPLSAKNIKSLKALSKKYADFISHSEHKLEDICAMAALRRTSFEMRKVFVAKDKSELLNKLNEFSTEDLSESEQTFDNDDSVKTVFIFPGQGAQYIQMGVRLATSENVFKEALEEISSIYKKYIDWDLLIEINKPEHESRLNEIDIVQPALVAIEIALAKLWISKGVVPDMVVGHSMGEVAAACIAGNITLDEAALIIITRSRLMKQLSGKGEMGVTDLTVEEATKILENYSGQLSIAVLNSKNSTVISGTSNALNEVFETLENQGRFNRKVKVNVASHSPQMDEITNPLEQSLSALKPQNTSVVFYSTVTNTIKNGEELNGAYWAANLRNTVQFSNVIQQISKENNAVYIEMSPHPTLIHAIKENLENIDTKTLVIGSFSKENEEQVQFYNNYTNLFAANIKFDWHTIYPSIGEFIELPTYAWQKEYYWIKKSTTSKSLLTQSSGKPAHSFLNSFLKVNAGLPAYCWQSTINLSDYPYLEHHKVSGQILFPAAGFLEMINEATKQAFPSVNIVLQDVFIKNALVLNENTEQLIQLTIQQQIGNTYVFQVESIAENNEFIKHCNGTIQLNDSIDINELLTENLHNAVSKQMHYTATSGMNLQYGDAFQQVENISYKDNIYKAVIAADNNIQKDLDAYNFHPSLLDACFQLFLTAAYTKYDNVLFIPASCRAFQFINKQEAYSKIEAVVQITAETENQLTGNIQISDEHKRILAIATDMVFERVDKKAEKTIHDLFYQIQWIKAEVHNNVPIQNNILIIHNNTYSESLKEHFLKQNASVHLIDIDSFEVNDFQKAILQFKDQKNYLFFVLDRQTNSTEINEIIEKQSQNAFAVINLIKSINNSAFSISPRLWIITQQAQSVKENEPIIQEQHQVVALCRTAWNEHFELRPTTIDISSENELDLIPLIVAQNNNENEIAVRGKDVFNARLEKISVPPQTNKKEVMAGDKSFTVYLDEIGVIDNLKFKQIALPEVCENEVLIEIKSIGINFMNLMSVLGIYPGKEHGFATLGIECTGIVKYAGNNISHIKVGDSVMGMAYHTMASHVVADGNAFRKIPEHLSFEEAATIPVVFLTAYYGLVELAKIKKGEKVLIHAATGGVGLAAIQIAKYYGAEIFATAGNEDKRAYLRSLGIQHIYNSRNIDFYDEILNDTNCEGVDIVLNSLTGDAMYKSMQLLKNFGRFVEIGKKDVYEDSKIGLHVFQNSLSYHMVDLEKMLFLRPDILGEMLQEVILLLNEGALTPLEKKVFPVQQIKDAFSYMNTSKHIGKIVIDFSAKEDVAIIQLPLQFQKDATYLLTGGYGGLGLTFTEWMFKNNARNFILIGRNKPADTAQNKIDDLIRQGASVKCIQCNISDIEELQTVISEIPELLPLKGVFHLAGILEDASIQNISRESYGKVLMPKISSYNLHLLTQHLSLDYFVLFSSSTVLFGSVGQVAYVAANAYMDALAVYRQSQQLPALSIQWGTVANVGLAAQKALRGDRLENEGITPLQPEECTAIFAALSAYSGSTVGAFYFDINKWKNHYTSAKENPFFNQLSDSKTIPVNNLQSSFSDRIKNLSNSEAQVEIEELLKEAVSQITKINKQNLHSDAAFKSFGIDSLMSVQLKNKLEKTVEIPLSVTAFWTYATIKKYTKFLLDKLIQQPEVSDKISVAETTEIQNQTPVIASSDNGDKDLNPDTISDDEVSRLLEEELKNL
ncbi:MAG TPA: SDR family NAD(P)-dependent oxidoreductase [Chitinophagales bacterium]|nr:SDR family NAD(P)-dependent oxidoreductase [Chitinophagales bacterium]